MDLSKDAFFYFSGKGDILRKLLWLIELEWDVVIKIFVDPVIGIHI